MFVRQRFKIMPDDTGDATVSDMKDVGLRLLQDQGRKGSDMCQITITEVAALGVEPGIGCIDDAAGSRLRCPRVRCAVVVGEETLDRRLGSDPSNGARGDAIGDRKRDTFHFKHGAFGDNRPMKVLVLRLPAGGRVLSDADLEQVALEGVKHRNVQEDQVPRERGT